MPKTTDFEGNVTGSGGYGLWSNAANWSNGTPADGDTVDLLFTTSMDDIPNLSLAFLSDLDQVPGEPNLNYQSDVYVSANLYVAQVYFAASNLTVEAAAGGGNVTVTIGTFTSATDGGYAADGPGATLIDDSPVNLEAQYTARDGGMVELAAAPGARSSFVYEDLADSYKGVFAFKAPSATNASEIESLNVGDVLELPGTAVKSVSLGVGNLTVTTSAGTYAFTNVAYAQSIRGYTAAVDAATGLVAITFNDINEFQQSTAAARGPLAGDYLWSNAANWSGGLPAQGASFTVGTPGYDDLGVQTVGTLTLDQSAGGAQVYATNSRLTIADVQETGGKNGLIEADSADAGGTAVVNISTIASQNITFGANGAGATLFDNATSDPGGEVFTAANHGLVEFGAAPPSTDVFAFGANATFAFPAAAAVNAGLIEGLSGGDTVELPGNSLTSVSLGATSLDITTSAGEFAFNSVDFAETILNYTTSFDAVTGLEAISFRGLDVFTPKVKDANGNYLWSNPANWSEGVTEDGDSVLINESTIDSYGDTVAVAIPNVDDIAALTLSSLLLGTYVDITGGTLAIGTLGVVTREAGIEANITADAQAAGAPVTVSINHNTISAGYYQADGAGARFIDNTPVDPSTGALPIYAGYYAAYNGGFIEIPGPQAAEDLSYTNSPTGGPGYGLGTLAFTAPVTLSYTPLIGVTPGDVLELPGSLVKSVTFDFLNLIYAGETFALDNSITVSTDAGTTTFLQVRPAIPIGSYSWAIDPTTGLVAITFGAPDVFSDAVSAVSGPLAGKFLWSNPANWSEGLPQPGGFASFASGAIGYDDISSLSLGGLNLNGGEVFVTGASLALGALSGGTVVADALDAGGPVTVSIAATSNGDTYVAEGGGASLLDLSGTDLGNSFTAASGGLVEFSSTLTSLTTLAYDGLGTFAFTNPGPVIGASVSVLTGDVLELPGNAVSAVSFGTTSLTIVTNQGTYNFTDVLGSLDGYTASFDAGTGLEAITFAGLDVFSDNVKATSGSLAGDYLWSNPANWSDGLPVNGSDVSLAVGATGYDDIASLSLGRLSMDGGELFVTGASLAVAVLNGGTATTPSFSGFYISTVHADATDSGKPVTVSIGSITGAGGEYLAEGNGAAILDLSATDPGGAYVDDGGLIEFAGTLSSQSRAGTYGTGTLAFANPGSVIAGGIGLLPGDVLELPGNAVSLVNLGTYNPNMPASLTIVTNTGTYDFGVVGQNSGYPITGYYAKFDTATGLEAITFTGPDIFSDNVKATSGSLAGDYLWSNPANWSNGLPVNGSDVSLAVGATGYDDIASLSLGRLSMDGGELFVTGASLAVAVLNGGTATTPSFSGFYISTVHADATDSGKPVTVSIGSITGAGGEYIADGNGAAILDLSATDPGGAYIDDGGLFEFAGTLSSQSRAGTYGTGTLAFANPGSVIAGGIGLLPGDVLELPGNAVSLVNLGTYNPNMPASLTIVTNTGTYDFGVVGQNPGYPISDYTAGVDPATGLEAITFTGSAIPALRAAAGQRDVIFANVTVASPIIAGGTVELAAASTVTGDISFSGPGGMLVIDPNSDGSTTIPANTITGFGAGDTIELAGVAFSGTSSDFGAPGLDSYTVATAGTLTIDAAGTFYELQIAGATFGQDNFVLSDDLQITEAACFAAGTRILTASGALVRVEDLREGDEVETFSGEAAPIIWVGRRTLSPHRHPRPEAVQPILITAGALGYSLPWRDLVVSPDHALYMQGHLIPAKALTNGFSIRQLDWKSVTYYHIELPEHAVLFAEGAPAESYLETGNRAAFENGGSAVTLHPDFAQSLREQRGCAPFAEAGNVVEAVRQRILDRAGIVTTGDPDLEVRYEDGGAIITSRSAIPGEIFADPRDRRLLGVKIARLKSDGHEIPLDHPGLVVGWHEPEPDGRWTNGRAEIPMDLLAGAKTLHVSLAAGLRYPLRTINGVRPAKRAGHAV